VVSSGSSLEMTANAVEDLKEAPAQGQWHALRGSFLELYRQLDAAQKRNRELERGVASAAVGAAVPQDSANRMAAGRRL